jgi:PAS domain S-box-containing protein
MPGTGENTLTLYTNLQSHLRGMFYRCMNDEHWTMVYVSEGCKNITGFSPEELLNNSSVSYASLIHPKDNERLIERINIAIANHTAFDEEYRLISKEGIMRWAHEIANGVYNEAGELICIEGYIEEITPKKDPHLFNNAFSSYHKAINSGSLVSISDTKGNILFANDLVCKYSGYTRKELIGKNHNILNSGYHSPAFFQELWQTITSGNIWRGEIRNKTKNGDFYWVDAVISPVLDQDGNIIQYLSVRNIITEQKNTALALQKSEQQLKEISSSIPGAVYQFKIDKDNVWSFPYMSGGAVAVLGITPEEAYSDVAAAFNRVIPEDLPELLETIRESAEKFIPWLHRFRIRQPNGALLWIRGNSIPKRLEDGGILWHGTLIDITESKENEELLKEANSQIQKIFDTLENAFWGYDPIHNRTLYASSGHIKTYGYSAEHFIQNENFWRDLIVEEDKKQIDELHQRLWHEKLVTNEYRIKHADGSVRWIESRMTGTKNELGELVRIDGIDTDITDRKKAEHEKYLLLEELRQKYNELMQFNYIVSHNLRSPIANIIGLSTLLEMEGISEDEMKILVSNIRISTARMDEVVKDLGIILSARSALHATKDKVSFYDLMSNIEGTLEKQIKDSNTVIIKKIAIDASTIFTIKSYLESIMFNLIGNAIKYRSADRTPVITVETSSVENHFVIKVQDNGIGIDLQKHGNDLFRLYKRFNFEVEGKGLGLHMVKTQVETLNGQIYVESKANEGTTFTINLPLSN